MEVNPLAIFLAALGRLRVLSKIDGSQSHRDERPRSCEFESIVKIDGSQSAGGRTLSR